jgi:hypothetical protein
MSCLLERRAGTVVPCFRQTGSPGRRSAEVIIVPPAWQQMRPTTSVIAMGALICALIPSSGSAAQATVPALEAVIRTRTLATFSVASLFKPGDRQTNELALRLAPFILQEVNPDPRLHYRQTDQFGRLKPGNATLTFDLTPAVYYYVDTMELAGKLHARVAFLWCYPPKPLTKLHPRLALQGVRLTLDSAGQPAIWEVLADTSGAEVIFVSRSLESAATNRFGPAPPGRTYAIERPKPEAPRPVVARIIEDGPVPMGPMVYLCAGTRDVSTVICPCMPVQARTLQTNVTYHLVPYTADATSLQLRQARDFTKCATAFWPGEEATDRRLEYCLRLPEGF